jgi:hypothetical protein
MWVASASKMVGSSETSMSSVRVRPGNRARACASATSGTSIAAVTALMMTCQLGRPGCRTTLAKRPHHLYYGDNLGVGFAL